MRPNHAVLRASGDLEDGRSFWLHLQEHTGDYHHIEVKIW
jgi:hypothetical protein